MSTGFGKLGLLLLLALALAGCAERLGEPYRVKITLEAIVSGEPQTITQVYEIQHFLCPQSFCAPERLSGDALHFDVGAKGLIMAPLSGKLADLLFSLHDAKLKGEQAPRDIFPTSEAEVRLLDDATGIYAFNPDLHFSEWIAFADRADPATGRKVYLPDMDRDVLEGIIRLESAAIERTSEPVTRTLAEKLPWLARLGDGKIEFPDHEALRYHYGPAVLVAAHFTTERD